MVGARLVGGRWIDWSVGKWSVLDWSVVGGFNKTQKMQHEKFNE